MDWMAPRSFAALAQAEWRRLSARLKSFRSTFACLAEIFFFLIFSIVFITCEGDEMRETLQEYVHEPAL